MEIYIRVSHPELLNKYLDFCQYRERFINSNVINLEDLTELYPTTLLPLIYLILEKPTTHYVLPNAQNITNYFRVIINDQLEIASITPPVPIIRLPDDQKQSDDAFQRIYQLQQNDAKVCGGVQTFKYIIEELVDNIYQHSSFTHALVMMQKYFIEGFFDLCIFDNGITIPKSFAKSGMIFHQHSEAIVDAINGLSSKAGTERGHGLKSTVKILSKGLWSQIFIVSGLGALFLGKEEGIRQSYPKAEVRWHTN